jgi:hypothetical protein
LGVEPFFNNIKCGIDTSDYVKRMQDLSSFDMQSKFVEELRNDIILVADYEDILQNQELFNYILHNLPQIIQYDAEPNGQYELQMFKLIVKKKQEQQPELKLC